MGSRRPLSILLGCLALALSLGLLGAPGCGGDGAAAGAPDAGEEGGEIVVATWNLGVFPHSAGAAAAIGESFDGLAVDLMAVEEVEDGAALDELAAARGAMVALDPPESMGTGPRLGVMWRPAAVDVSDVDVRFVGDPAFPRPVVRATVARAGGGVAVGLVIVHLKAGVAATEEQQRLDAVAKVVDLVATEFAGQDAIVLGDFNEAPGDARSGEVFAPFLDTTGGYDLITWPLALDGTITFLPAGIMLDHIALTAGLAGADQPAPMVPPLDQQIADYTTTVSDHVPVVVRLRLP